MEMALTFNDVTITPIHYQNSLWIRAAELARALGYAREDKVSRLYQRNADEFTPDMTQVIEITADPQNGVLANGRCRIFSLRGCHLLAMLARTAIAKAFRKWVLDILDKLAEEERAALCGNVKEIPDGLSTAASRAPLRSLVHAWAQVSGISHSALWPQVRAHFQLSRIDDLPESWLPDALAFVQEKIDQCVQGLPNAAPAAELPPAPEERPLVYRDGKYYPMRRNHKHVVGPREKAMVDFWSYEYPRREAEIEERFKKLMEGIDTAMGDTIHQAVAAIGRDADTMFSISCMLEGLYSAEDRARESFKEALRLARLHMRMATSMATALNR
ncbi:MAG: hypothetical protein HDR50_06825 [Desulfovibrio sp.]|uniref:BRO-N domain-containing protein n=1 Tax=Desulfovibrio sp. TaxID=885 RepID=UPI001A651771|nr:BRO family protein [Desulfovibrio sp.]MBD5417361.1 hypothetical protein [Desulfovibrio sp.]